MEATSMGWYTYYTLTLESPITDSELGEVGSYTMDYMIKYGGDHEIFEDIDMLEEEFSIKIISARVHHCDEDDEWPDWREWAWYADPDEGFA